MRPKEVLQHYKRKINNDRIIFYIGASILFGLNIYGAKQTSNLEANINTDYKAHQVAIEHILSLDEITDDMSDRYLSQLKDDANSWKVNNISIDDSLSPREKFETVEESLQDIFQSHYNRTVAPYRVRDETNMLITFAGLLGAYLVNTQRKFHVSDYAKKHLLEFETSLF